MELHQTTDGTPLYTGVGSKFEALSMLKSIGIAVETEGTFPIYTTNFFTRLPQSTGEYVHMYFFDRFGVEKAYYTPPTKTLMICSTPRIWHQSFKDQLEIKKVIQ